MDDYNKVWNKICVDLNNGEHVDGHWVKDSFDLAGYQLVPHKRIDDLIIYLCSLGGFSVAISVYQALYGVSWLDAEAHCNKMAKNKK